MSGGPLTGVRVLDLTRLLPGPMATLHLADLGADVIKIEDPGAGDYARTLGDGPEGISVFYRCVNRNKRGLRLDLKQPAGRAIFMRLLPDADIVVESFRPGVADKLGIGYAALRAVKPALVYCAITGYGQTGPLAQDAGHDLNYIGFSGVLEQIGVDGGPPAIPNLQIGDLLGGALTATMGILAALFDARRSGQGRLVDVAMSEAVMAHNLFPLFALQNEGQVPERGGDLLSGGNAGYGVYRTADGRYMAVAPLEKKFWDIFCDALERPDWKPRYGARGAAAQALRDELAQVFIRRDQQDWSRFFAPFDCCVTPILDVGQALAHPQFIARGMRVDADGVTQYAPPLKLSGWDFAVERHAPAPGEHSAQILGEAGYSAAEIAALQAAAVI
ncbi:MAG TPA: CaiB/BaiF CoA-transferase family protein [Accumulibacter sp.]|nr:CaiB/BaiF CoA-transferase family protein [Accumulibacter sp.]HMW18799.1 CaiB/BaiF CoA-transferase family protein [Accumulibacter sp.]HNC18822.1 CaiB/BaiF CoA-transferase family protein [Accumulibacter sp.]HND80846.1 CaiB/BaiF CoA-transferase family protein [Accumulibacter sp.]HNE12246.1 CaiB/BaiF CoA-transferase family protein [Accumulibacter sp.]